jgi:hypothetical protein
MLNHCANSCCRAAFDYRLGGMFFRFTKQVAKLQHSQEASSPNRTHDVQHFWLCGQCSKTYTLISTDGAGVQLRPVASEAPAQITARKASVA